MSIKIIASDLDGTLMSTDHVTVTERTYNALYEAHKMGVKIAIATGRPLALTDNVVKQVPFVDYVITANGAGVFDRKTKKCIYSNFIPNNIAVEITKYFLSQRVFFDVYIDGRSQYQIGTEKHFDQSTFPDEFLQEALDSMDAREDLIQYLGDKDIEKITLYDVKDCDYDKFKSKMIESGLNPATSFVGNLEATLNTASKGVALKGLCDKLGFSSNEAMSFGDAENDCSMLEFADYSFAMANGCEHCKAVAKYVANSNGDDGVAQEIERFVLKNSKTD